MRIRKSNLIALTLFVVLTIFMTYPLILQMGSGVGDLGDPLLNAWIMSWNVKKMTSLELHDYFNTNIFFPHQRTLAYSEHLFSQSLVALPFLLLFRNPILAYNFVLLFSFVTSGLGMYLLARHLTKNILAGIVAGIIYAFSPFMFSHMGHMQIITAGGIPLAFLFLHKFFKDENFGHLLLFTLFFLLQVLANGYYALYLSFFVSLFIFIYMITQRRYKDWRFWIKMAVFISIVLAVAGPFYRQYYLVRGEMGFMRNIDYSASFSSFLFTNPVNRLYGDIGRQWVTPEGALFPGLMAFLLAVVGIGSSFKKDWGKKPFVEKHTYIYAGILVLAFLFTFGSKGPYVLLYKYVPGFDGLRVAARFHILVMFSVAILSAFGIKAVLSHFRLKKRGRYFFAIPLCLLLLMEYLSVPIPLETVAVREKIPEVYRWLAAKEGTFAIIELPLPKPRERVPHLESLRLFYSTYHWKKLVNGRSGYFPPLYRELKRRWQKMSLKENLVDLRRLGVEYILIHSSLYEQEELRRMLFGLEKAEKEAQYIKKIGKIYVYQVVEPPVERSIKALYERKKIIPKKDWKANSNVMKDVANFAIDQELSTRWGSDTQDKEVFLEIDLGQVYKVKGLSFRLGLSRSEYPRDFRIEVSKDGLSWESVFKERLEFLPITIFLKPKAPSLDIVFSPHKARHIKIINNWRDEAYTWSIYEIDVFE